MSSETVPRPKRRRLPNACDICRKQKARCDSAEMPGNRCSNCVAFNSECTHTYRPPEKSSSTQKINLPQRTAQNHIASILGGSHEYISGDPLAVYQVLLAVAQYARRLEEALSVSAVAEVQSRTSLTEQPLRVSETPSDETDSASDSEDELLVTDNLPKNLRQIIRQDISTNRFYGKSSSLHFMKTLINIKMSTLGETQKHLQREDQWQRAEYWNVRPWELPSEIFVPQLFPDTELLNTLMDLYFVQVNPLIYVLHEPTFRRAVGAGLHHTNQQFGALLLAVCALGAKVCDDPRVILEGGADEMSAGWRWFTQVRPVPASFVMTPTLYELQLVCLSMMYLASGSAPEVCYTLVGVGLRMATDTGAHRRIRSNGDTVESEMFKRVFWVLAVSDAIMSSLMGRPKASLFEEMDLDLPAALEGEDPHITVYAALINNLMKIWSRIQDIIYSPKHREQGYQDVVAELDSALNQWVDSIPEQLRWDPEQLDLIKLNQSACLYAQYYHVQIHLHRPFISPPEKESGLPSISFPSRAICWNAARSCIRVLEVQCKRGMGPMYNPQTISTLFDAAAVLLMNEFLRSRSTTNETIQRCLDVLQKYERRWQIAGRNADIISLILNLDRIPQTLKRSRSADENPPSSFEAWTNPVEGQRTFAGSRRVASVVNDMNQLQVSEAEFHLPLHTVDLGRPPPYEPFDLESMFDPETAQSLGGMGHNVELAPSLPIDFSVSPELFGQHWGDWSPYYVAPGYGG